MDDDKTHNDLELDTLLGLLRETPARDPHAVERGRAKYISDVDQLFGTGKSNTISWLEKLLQIGWLGKNREQAGMRRTMKLSYTVLLATMVLAVLLFSGARATAFAAQSALPGDALYRIKMSIEQTQVRLAADAARRAELHLEFAEHRLDEISGLIAEGRYGEIEHATQEFEYQVQQALIAMQTVAAGDPLRAQVLAVRVTLALSEYVRSLSGMKMNVPESTRASMERAITTSQNASDISPAEFNQNENESTIESINSDNSNSIGDDQGNDQSNQNGGFINENENENENHNGEENTNLNSNVNDESNDNHDDQKSGDNQNSNSNLNDQKNDNHNDSGGDNSNDQHNDNNNDNDRDDGGNGNGGDD